MSDEEFAKEIDGLKGVSKDQWGDRCIDLARFVDGIPRRIAALDILVCLHEDALSEDGKTDDLLRFRAQMARTPYWDVSIMNCSHQEIADVTP